MVRIVFKGFDGSESDREGATDRIQKIVDRFPDLAGHKIVVTLSQENGELAATEHGFGAKMVITGKKYSDIVLQKSGSNLWIVFAEMTDATLERLNRYGDKVRVKERKREAV